MEESPNTPVEAWRQLIGIVGLRRSNIIFAVFALACVAVLFYQGRTVGGVFILVFATIHATRADTLLVFLLADRLRRLFGVAR